jgi:hypothetical protein
MARCESSSSVTLKRSIAPGADLVTRPDPSIEAEQCGVQNAVEIPKQDYRRPDFLQDPASHNLARALNASTSQPSLDEQSSLPDALTPNLQRRQEISAVRPPIPEASPDPRALPRS